ncbi:hypothetical protein N0V88_003823 [Collariella sp. IMI 366227]|nr:hypothetical protein N0V88_003823 [Collariella sp. IMI 366227]
MSPAILVASGLSSFLLEDFVSGTQELLERLAELINDRTQAMRELVKAFNDQSISSSILYHFRLLASTYLKNNRDTYGAFVTTDSGVDGYCQEVLERHGVEIDHLGLTLLVNVLLKPVDFVLEVAYLDRSPGPEVNTYRFPEEANNRHASELGAIIHLLYRPDHYDLLYAPEPVNLQVHRVGGFSQSYEIQNTPMGLHSYGGLDFQHLSSIIPGFGTPTSSLAPLLDTNPSPLTAYSPSPASPWVSTPYVEPIQQAPPPPPLPVSTPAPQPQTHPLRFSEYCQLREYTENNTWRDQTLQTSMFKNSHFNVAHYNNPNFQPEEYRPGAEEHDTPPRSSGRKRGSV